MDSYCVSEDVLVTSLLGAARLLYESRSISGRGLRSTLFAIARRFLRFPSGRRWL